MAETQVRASTQVLNESIYNAQIASAAAIATSKLADAANFILRGGSVAFTADQSMGNHKLTNVAAPQASTDAANKAYVDGVASGLNFKSPVRAATTSPITDLADVGSNLAIDAIALVEGDRILVKDQTNAYENGIYIYNQSLGTLIRASDADTSAEVKAGLFVFVNEGATYADTSFVLSTNDPIILGTTNLTFAQFASAGNIMAGLGLTKTGYTIDVGAGDGIDVTADVVSVDVTDFIDTLFGLTENNNDIRINLSASGGLAFSGTGALQAKVKTNAGISVDGDGFAVAAADIADTSKGLSVTLNKIGIDAGDGIDVGDDVAVDVTDFIDTLFGLTENNNDIRVKLESGGGLEFATSGGIQLASNILKEADYVCREAPTGTIDGSNKNFVLSSTPIAGSEMVYLNGLLQDLGGGNDYTITGNTITFVQAPLAGDKIRVTYWK